MKVDAKKDARQSKTRRAVPVGTRENHGSTQRDCVENEFPFLGLQRCTHLLDLSFHPINRFTMKFTLVTVAALFASADAFSVTVSLMIVRVDKETWIEKESVWLVYFVNNGCPTSIR